MYLSFWLGDIVHLENILGEEKKKCSEGDKEWKLIETEGTVKTMLKYTYNIFKEVS